MFTRPRVLALLALAAFPLACTADDETIEYGFGVLPSEIEVAEADIDVRFDGQGLPPGTGTPAEGERVYEARCASCHGRELEGNAALRVKPLLGESRNAISKLPYAPPLFAYVRRAMPLTEPGSLSNDDAYAVVAYLLWQADVLTGRNTKLNAERLSRIEMPNRENFFVDDGSRLAGKATR